MKSQADNDALTLVGRGTPAGELLRRYWHPVALACELTETKPTRAVTILGEKLVVFRMPPEAGSSQPRYGLVHESCPHRLASLAYGSVDNDGIRCPYHGWKFDASGQCIEQPAEPPGSRYKEEIRQPAYPVQKLAGLLFAYMGPLPAPLLPRWDVLARCDGRRWIVKESVLGCNWLQPMENSVDPSHAFWLHGANVYMGGPHSQYQERHEFVRVEYGIMKQRFTPGDTPAAPEMLDQHPLVFPTSLRQLLIGKRGARPEDHTFRHVLHLRVPLDDTHTQIYRVYFMPLPDEVSPPDQDPPMEYLPLKDAQGAYLLDVPPGDYFDDDPQRLADVARSTTAQDAMAWETQGPITDRTREHLGVSDRGIVMYRKLLKEQIDIVRNGGVPMGVIRDPAKNTIIDLDVVNERLGLFRARHAAGETANASS
jgi:5,5'-dehydrodivanillate O-demethylase